MQIRKLTLIAATCLLLASVPARAVTMAQCTAAHGTPTVDDKTDRPGWTGKFCSGGDGPVKDQPITDKGPKPRPKKVVPNPADNTMK